MPSSTCKPEQASHHPDCCIFDDMQPKGERKVIKGKMLQKTDIEVIELDLGSVCNLDCPLCHRNWKDAQHLIDGNNQRDVKDVISQLEEYPNLRTITIAGIISEPTLYKDFLKLVKYIASRNILFYIYTNAETHNEEYWEELGKLCNEKTLVYFTICGPTQEIHEKYRVNSKLETILINHQAFRKGMRYANDVLQYLFFEYNKDDYKGMGDIRSLFSKESSINSMAYKERFELIKDVNDDMSMPHDLSKKYQVISEAGMRRFKPGMKMDCSSYNRRFTSIDNNGNTYPCYMHRVYNHDMNWGGDYTKILNAEYDFCYECENFTSEMIKATKGLLRIVEC